MKIKEIYTVYDILEAEHYLEPLRCIHCGAVGYVVYLQYVEDGQCEWCGEWQLEPEGA